MRRGLARYRSCAGDRRGATAVEFALISPLLVVLLAGVLLFGQAFYTVSSVQWAIEETSRELMLDSTLTEAAFQTRLDERLNAMHGVTVDVTLQDTAYGEITVTLIRADLVYPVQVPLIPDFEIRYTMETEAPRPIT